MAVRGKNVPKDISLLVPFCRNSREEDPAAAKLWLDGAKQAGLKPLMVQRSLESEDAGEWYLCCAVRSGSLARPSPLPGGLLDEVFLILEKRGDIVPATELKPWHGAVFLDDTSCRAIALRLRLARRSLNLNGTSFYKPIQRDPFITPREASFSENELRRLCDCHGIPEEWLTTGTPAELELPA